MKKLFIPFFVIMLAAPMALAAMEISFDKTQVTAGGTLTITYHETAGGSYGIVQQIPTGWSGSDLSPDGNYRTYVDSGADHSITLTAPSQSVTSTFNGEYFVYPATTYTAFSPTTVTVGAGGTPPPPSGNGDGFDTNILYYIGGGIVLIWILTQK